MKSNVSVIIPVYNDAFNLEKCLNSIYDTPYTNFEVIVVDDASIQDFSAILKSFNCRYFRLDVNRGPSGARNRGVKESLGDIILFTDSDCKVMKDWVAEFSGSLIGLNKESPDVVAVSGKLESPKGFIEMSHSYTGYAYVQGTRRHFTEYLNTSCAALYKKYFWGVGGFSEDMRNGEDPDLALKLVEGGKKIIFEPSIRVFHNHGVDSFKKMVLKHKQWGRDLGLSLMQKHPERFKFILPLLLKPWVHFLLIVPMALATTIKIVVVNFKSDKKVLFYAPCIFINKIFFRWGIFIRSLKTT